MTRKSKLAILVTVVAAVGLLGLRHARVVELDRAPVLSQPATAVQAAPVRRATVALGGPGASCERAYCVRGSVRGQGWCVVDSGGTDVLFMS